MRKKLNRFIYLLKEDLGLLFSISIGVFLFVLFFQPFPFNNLDINNQLLFIAGLAAIVFVFIAMSRIVLPRIARTITENHRETVLPAFISGFIILALNSVAFAFYLKYVGRVDITFHIMFKVVLISLAPLLIIRMYNILNELKRQNKLLYQVKKQLQNELENLNTINLQKNVVFFSENNSEKLNIQVADVTFIKSADNYVEIVYKEEGTFKKKLIRNTLKNIEHQVNQYTNFIRCHRTCIVNTNYAKNLIKKFNNYWISIKDYDEQIPVSRQYLMNVKELIPTHRGE